MYVIIVGGSRTGAQLARLLLNQNHEVRVIEGRKEILSRIHHELPTEVIVEGSFIDPDILEQAGARKANVLAAVTSLDEINLVLCVLARETYGIKRTIARVNDPGNSWLFNSTFHVDVVVNHAEIMARLIEEEMSMGDMMTLLKLRRGNYSLVEEKIPENACAIGVMIKDLGLSENCCVAAIIRKGELIIPRGVTPLEAGDEVLAVTDREGAQLLAKLLAPPQEEC